MNLRFRRSIKIAPGVRLNIGKKGVSASLGVRGAQVTVGRGRVTKTVGLPGTGIHATRVEQTSPQQPVNLRAWIIVILVALAVVTALRWVFG